MKIIVLVFLLLSAPACAQQPIRAPVNVATILYRDCLQLRIEGDLSTELTRVGVKTFVSGVDDYCLGWTVIWYKPLMGTRIDQISEQGLQRFQANRLSMLKEMTDILTKKTLQ